MLSGCQRKYYGEGRGSARRALLADRRISGPPPLPTYVQRSFHTMSIRRCTSVLNTVLKRNIMSSEIPSIDFSRVRDGSLEGCQEVAAEIDRVLKGFGCFFLRDHGIQQNRIDTCFEWVNFRGRSNK
jgi:hypothetical protein